MATGKDVGANFFPGGNGGGGRSNIGANFFSDDNGFYRTLRRINFWHPPYFNFGTMRDIQFDVGGGCKGRKCCRS